MTDTPAALGSLAASYEGLAQPEVRFRPDTWDRKLSAPASVTALLRSERHTDAAHQGGAARAGDRRMGRQPLLDAASAMELDDPTSVLQVFVMTMAWGSGTSGSRSLRNTASALADPQRAHDVLRCAAETLRDPQGEKARSLEDAHRQFLLPGVGEAFFTKWFTFAGHVPGRAWQPLILDSRVRASLRHTLGVDLGRHAAARRPAARYVAYVEMVHAWVEELGQQGLSADPARIEWILFAHNGAAAV